MGGVPHVRITTPGIGGHRRFLLVEGAGEAHMEFPEKESIIFFLQKSNLEFLLGGKDIGTLPITISLVVRSEKIIVIPTNRNKLCKKNKICSFMSAVTLLGTPGEIYVYGTQVLIF